MTDNEKVELRAKFLQVGDLLIGANSNKQQKSNQLQVIMVRFFKWTLKIVIGLVAILLAIWWFKDEILKIIMSIIY
jgi:hypothetical protein